MKELEQRIIENGIDYVLTRDYYYPNPRLLKNEEAHYGKYGSISINCIKQHKKGLYSSLYMKGKHCPIKDAGKKCFGTNFITDIGVINDLLQRAKLTNRVSR